MLRILEVIGRVLGYALIVVFLLAITAVDIYVLLRYGLVVWLFVLPIALGLAWFCIAMTAFLMSLLVTGLVRFFGWLVRLARPPASSVDDGAEEEDGA